MGKISLDESTLYIIRAWYDGEPNVKYYYQSPVPDGWTNFPSMATIFRDYEVAEEHKTAAHRCDPDGLIYEVVSLKNEMIANQKQKSAK